MFSMLLALLPAALSAEGNGRSGLVWPGASSSTDQAGEVALGTGLAVGGEEELVPHWSSSYDLVLSPGERWAFESQALFGPDHFAGFVGGRAVVLQREHVRLAPWAGAFLLGPVESTGWDLMPLVGVAVDARWGRWGGDLSAPLVGVLLLREGDPPMVMPGVFLGELGVSFHPSEATSLRLGVASTFPTLRWRHELGERWFYELDVASAGQGAAQARGGLRF